MRHANSNLNLLKKNKISKTIKINNFLKPPSTSYNFISPMTTKSTNNKNILYNLLYKDNSKISVYSTKNTTNTYKNTNEISSCTCGKYSFTGKNLCNNSTSMGNSLTYKENRARRGHVNIRLKLNSKIINNNFNKKNKVRQKAINFDMIEKIKQKDSQINKLQKDLFQSQELLNKLQKDKQKELSFTYNSLKSLDNMNIINLSKEYRLFDFFASATEKNDKILKTNFNKLEMNKSRKKTNNKISKYNNSNCMSYNSKNLKSLLKLDSLINLNINLNQRNNKNNNKNIASRHSISGFNKNIFNVNNKYIYNIPSNNYYIRCFSSSPNRCFPHGPEQYELCLSLTKNNLNNKKKDKKKSLNKTESKINNICSKISKNNASPSLENLISKCNVLKNKANNILSNYISLTEYLIDCSKNN